LSIRAAGAGRGTNTCWIAMISGGDHAPWGVVLYLISAAALLALIVLIIRSARAAAATDAARTRGLGQFGSPEATGAAALRTRRPWATAARAPDARATIDRD
jgi:hypothetical protein